ncbi:uncharacterized protein LOC128159306 [Crassostrea angulata]|uniref:uncharacterized protein LOC128159306 n=1 Tax=Magallana angulata TaxID=2784310 RepID=UPI0022B164BA|nr:uncharacterized protein LOC128159306 [Crassostrea angulata]
MGEIKVKLRNILNKHLDETKKIQSLIKQTLLFIEEIEKSTEVFSTIEYNSKIRQFSKLPTKVQASLPIFIPKPIDPKKLYSLFGQMAVPCLATATGETGLSLDEPNISVRELLDDPELVATIHTGCKDLCSVARLNDDLIYTNGITSAIQCFIVCSLLQTVETESLGDPVDIAVDGDGDLLYSDKIAGTVNKVKNEETEELIELEEWTPGQLCVTSTGNILITICNADETQSKVVRYSGSTEKQTIQFNEEGNPLYSGNNKIKYITENRNHDICVADYVAGAIVVVDQDGKLRWRYTGHSSVTKNKSFHPVGITSDSQSHILTADFKNDCIHILDQSGQFLRNIDICGLRNPFGLCVDNDDNLFVCEYYKGNVKKIKYLK